MNSLDFETLMLVCMAVILIITAMSLFVREVGVVWENLVDLTPIFLAILGLAMTLIALSSVIAYA